MKKRICSLVSVLCLMSAMLPMTAFAEASTTAEEMTEEALEAAPAEDDIAEMQTEEKLAAVPAADDMEDAKTEEALEAAPAVDDIAEMTAEEGMIAVFAADGIAEVTTKKEMQTALSDDSVTEIHVIQDMAFTDSIDSSKVIEVEPDVTLTVGGYQTTVSGTIVNNGTIRVTSSGKCTWKAATSGSGKLVAANVKWGEYQTYVDYGCVPEAMMENCQINIVKDLSVRPTVSLPENMQVGDMITPTVTNLIDGVDIVKVFKYTWKNGNSSQVYNGAATPTLTAKGTLKLNLAAKKPYVMCSSSGSYGSIDASGTVAAKLLDVVYVDAANGKDSNMGDSTAAAVKNLGTAADKMKDGGTIVLCGDYSGSMAYIEKNVTIRSAGENPVKLALSDFSGLMIAGGVNVTLDHIDLAGTTVSAYGSGTDRTMVFHHCTGKTTLTNGNAQFGSVTLSNSNLSGYLYAADSLTMHASTFSGQFVTDNFVATGSNQIVSKKNAPVRINGTITTESPVTIAPAVLERGEKLVEVAKDSAVDTADHFALTDDQNGKYVLKCRIRYNGTYIGLSERVETQDGRFAVSDEPVIGQEVKDPAVNFNRPEFGSAAISLKSAVWSGYTDVDGKTWSLGDIPELTITLSTDVYDNPFSHFDDTFDAAKLKICTWADTDEMSRFDDELVNAAAVCLVKEGQGVSDDGRTFTFTVRYPEVTRLSQQIAVDTVERTANCGDVLEAREAAAQSKITYESSDPEVASVDAQTGKITVHKAGRVMITLRAEQTDVYEAAETKYPLIVTHAFSSEWKHDDKEHWKECACGEKGEVGSHSGGKADTAHKADCAICGTAYGEIAKADDIPKKDDGQNKDNDQTKDNTQNNGNSQTKDDTQSTGHTDNSGTRQQDNGNQRAVATGDDQPVMMWAMLLLISGLAVAAGMRKRKNRG